MLEKVWKTICENNLIKPGELVLAAVSGGPDSLAMLHALHILSKRGGYRLQAAHLNHSFRGQEADAEASWVKQTAEAWGINCTVAKVDVPGLIRAEGLSPQEAGRAARREFFLSLLQELQGQKIALGQQADDQAETILMHLLSGAGTEGLQGMRVKNHPFIRPLLYITRSEIEEYCRIYQLDPRRDPSNAKNIYLRNRIRNQLMPWLKENINSNLVSSLQKTATIIQSEEDYWQGIMEGFAKENLSRTAAGELALNLAAFQQAAVAVQRRVLRQICQELTGEQGPAFLHVEEMRKLACGGQVGKKLILPGPITVVKGYDQLLFALSYQETVVSGIQPRALTLPGETLVPETGQRVKATIVQGKPPINTGKICLPLPAQQLPQLIVRSRQAGDWLMPLGMSGRKSLKEFFIDRKIPPQERDQLLLISAGQEIIWIPGLVVINRIKGDSPQDKYLQLEVISV